MNAADWLSRPEHGDRPALHTLQATYTHAQLTAASEGLAAWLIAAGARPGHFVGVLAENSFFSLACWLGAMRAGCVAVPLSASVPPETWRFIVASTGLRVACLQKCTQELAGALPEDARMVTEGASDDPRAVCFDEAIHTPKVAWPELGAGALAMVLFTSGSTGVARGVKITHRNLVANATGIIQALGLQADDRVMVKIGRAHV